MIAIESISKLISEYTEDFKEDDHHREKSWVHCYRYFGNHDSMISDETIDVACLHLGFYLASWGMYKGSSFLVNKDYRLHEYTVRTLLKTEYSYLWNLGFDACDRSEEVAALILQLKEDLIHSYTDQIVATDGSQRRVNITDTLITKIMLGTMACLPDFDNYFIIGLKKASAGFKSYRLNLTSIMSIFSFCQDNMAELKKAQEKVFQETGIKYPMMKLVDMYFWQLGYTSNSRKV